MSDALTPMVSSITPIGVKDLPPEAILRFDPVFSRGMLLRKSASKVLRDPRDLRPPPS